MKEAEGKDGRTEGRKERSLIYKGFPLHSCG